MRKAGGIKSRDWLTLTEQFSTYLLADALAGRPICGPVLDLLGLIATFISPTNAHVATWAKMKACEARTHRIVRAYEAVVPPPERTIVLHLLLHIPRQQYWWGPAWTHWMFPFERMVGELKRLHSHRLHPEASVMRNWQTSQFSLIIPQRYPALKLEMRPSSESGKPRAWLHVAVVFFCILMIFMQLFIPTCILCIIMQKSCIIIIIMRF